MFFVFDNFFLLWNYAVTELWRYGDMELWSYEAMELLSYGTMEVQRYGIMEKTKAEEKRRLKIKYSLLRKCICGGIKALKKQRS